MVMLEVRDNEQYLPSKVGYLQRLENGFLITPPRIDDHRIFIWESDGQYYRDKSVKGNQIFSPIRRCHSVWQRESIVRTFTFPLFQMNVGKGYLLAVDIHQFVAEQHGCCVKKPRSST